MYKKIDIYIDGSYVCSTFDSKTCKEAVRKFKDLRFSSVIKMVCEIKRKQNESHAEYGARIHQFIEKETSGNVTANFSKR